MAAIANKVDEIINSPERNPYNPVINTITTKISFLNVVIVVNPV